MSRQLQTYTPPALRTAASPIPEIHLAHREINIADPSDRDYLMQVSTISRRSSVESWRNYRRIGEVRYAVARSQRIAGYATLRGVQVDRAGNIKATAKDTSRVAEIVAGIDSRFGGLRGLIERFYLLRKIPAEGYLIGLRDSPESDRDGYWFMSPSEIYEEGVSPEDAALKPIKWMTARRVRLDGSESAFTREVARDDFYGRLWTPDGEFVDEVDSPMAALNGLCDILHDLTESIRGKLRSRFMMNGIFLIPSEIQDAAINSKVKDGLYSSDKVLNYFIHLMTTNMLSRSEAIDQMPLLLKGPAAVLDMVRHLLVDFQIHETDLRTRSEVLNVVLDGLDQQKQAVKGGEGLSHWGVWAVADEERRITVQPDLEAMCHALTRMVLWRELKALKWDPAKIRSWRVTYDLSAAAVKSNMGEDARQGWDRGLVNAKFLRNVIGATETDAMDDAEYIRWVGVKMANPVLAVHGLNSIDVEWDRASAWGKTSGPNPDSPADPSNIGPGVGDPGSPDSRDSNTPKTQEPG